ncbi:MAG: MASE1 domain-containing protein, partial [Pseudomonadota bacterium]|nr:MASE1 domain-containing protein [Pseudomonadota bacterium]
MRSWPVLIRPSVLGLAYFVAASLAVSLTRYDGGVAFLWVASSLLIAELMRRPRRQWVPPIAGCAIGNFLATGLFGLGWAAAGPFVAINIIEATVAAWTLRRFGRSLQPLGSLNWLTHFVASVAIVAPLVAAGLATAAMVALGKPPGSVFMNFYAGHALGNIVFTPLALLFNRDSFARTLKAARRRTAGESASLLLLVLVTCLIVFRQTHLPLLFLPILPIILVIFRIGRGGAAVSIALLAVIGGRATSAGLGPFHLNGLSMGAELQFFQFYLAATVLTVLPIVVDLQNRSRLHRDIRRSEERYRLMAEHSSDILFHLDADGRIRYVSPSVLQLGGHDSSALIGRNCRTLIAPEHLERVREAHAETLAKPGETQTYD